MKKRTFSAEFKAKVVLEALREEKSLTEIASENNIHPNVLRGWKKEFLEKAGSLFEETKQQRELNQKAKEIEAEHAQMLKIVGQLTLERDWLRKNRRTGMGGTHESAARLLQYKASGAGKS